MFVSHLIVAYFISSYIQTNIHIIFYLSRNWFTNFCV